MANSGSGIKSLCGCGWGKTIRDIGLLYLVFGRKKSELKPVAGYVVGRRIDSWWLKKWINLFDTELKMVLQQQMWLALKGG